MGRRSARATAGGGGGGTPPEYRDSARYLVSGSSITVDPAGGAHAVGGDTLTYQSGDVLVLFAWGYTSLGAPSGSDLTWTERLSDTDGTPFGGTSIHKVWTAVADASITSFTVANGAADQIGAVLVAVSGADTTSPVDAAAISSAGFDAVADPTSPSVAPTGTDSLLLCGAGVWPNADGTSSFTPPTGMTERADFESWDSYTVASEALTSSGATGTRVFVESPAITVGNWIASSIALRSAA
jgi:hypothetical protein